MLVKSLIYTSIIAALAVSGPAFAANGSAATNTGPVSVQTNQTNTAQATNSAASVSGGKNSKNEKNPKKAQVLKGVTVTGILQSQEHAIQLKRDAPSIQDSITSVSIGQLPDITIANSLSRITGVQIDRSAGEGTTINIRGLPEVSTLINGEAFLTADNIFSIQPNYESLPSSLFAGADVIKSPTADMLTSGISGTVNLRTRQPWNLPFGWTVAGGAEAGRGQIAGKTKPNANVLFNYNADGRWGALLAISYSDFVHSFAETGWDQASGDIFGENHSSANVPSLGYLTGWSGSSVPPEIKRFPNGSVDVNGDGKSNGAFWQSPRFQPANELVEPKRIGIDSAFQYAFGSDLTLTADGFFTHQTEYTSNWGPYTLPVSQSAPTGIPLVSHDTGLALHNQFNTPGVQQGNWNQQFFTQQKYRIWIGDLEPQTRDTKAVTTARNFNVGLHFNNGGPLSWKLRWVSATAARRSNDATIQTSNGNGGQWHNTLMPGVSLPNTIYVHPANMGGNYPFNPNGFAQYSYSDVIDWEGENPVVTIPAAVYAKNAQESTWVAKSIYADGSESRGGMNIVRLDGKFRFDPQFSVNFGFRNSIRSASRFSYVFAARRYAGDGASDPAGCLVRWTTSDIVMSGGGVPGACTAGNQYGYFRGNEFMGPISKLPPSISAHMMKFGNLAQTTGMVSWGVNPSALRDPANWYKTLEESGGRGEVLKVADPSTTWNVLLHQRTLYGQANFQGEIAGHSFSGNAGVRVIRTNLHVTQNLTGAAQPYGVPQAVAGKIYTNRQYTDILPALNVAIDLTPKLKLRLAGSKNMMPLSLNQWGGGTSRTFAIQTLPNGNEVEAAVAASSNGNPELKPWRSTNFGASLEYYINSSSMFSIAAFRMRIASFILQSSRIACNIPDQDGVVRRCIAVSGPVQGAGTTLHGVEADYRQALTFLPGVLSNTGFQVNGTYSPSDQGSSPSNPSGKDLAGNNIPFPDNSKYEGNLVLWYQGPRLEAHLGVNYRSKRAVAQNYAGVTGFEEYEAPTTYVDANVTYKINRQLRVYVEGENLTDERQNYYLVWPDEKNFTNLSERFYMVGVRFKF